MQLGEKWKMIFLWRPRMDGYENKEQQNMMCTLLMIFSVILKKHLTHSSYHQQKKNSILNLNRFRLLRVNRQNRTL